MTARPAPRAALMPLTLTLPVPPATLGKNTREHWRVVRRDYGEAKRLAYYTLREIIGPDELAYPDYPLVLDVVWRQPNRRWWPDDDNGWSRLAAYRDAAQAIGLVVDDRYIRCGLFTCTHGTAGVVLTFREEDE